MKTRPDPKVPINWQFPIKTQHSIMKFWSMRHTRKYWKSESSKMRAGVLNSSNLDEIYSFRKSLRIFQLYIYPLTCLICWLPIRSLLLQFPRKMGKGNEERDDDKSSVYVWVSSLNFFTWEFFSLCFFFLLIWGSSLSRVSILDPDFDIWLIRYNIM